LPRGQLTGGLLRLAIRDARGRPRLTPGLVAGLAAALAAEREARVVALEGGPGAFCEGLDLDAPGPGEAPELERFAALLRAIEGGPRPVIALVDGPALGGGVGLAAAADVVLATPRATFGLPETLLGLVPATVLPVVVRRLGPAGARRLALGAATLSAAEAWRLGLVDEVTDDLEPALARCVERLARMDPRALAEVKALVARYHGTPEAYGADAAGRFRALWASPATRERLARFSAGDTPWPDPDGR
jgi:enoyl-CoA hydratase/carnithine racemase